MIWDPSFTKSFSNAPFVPPPDDFVSQNFERQIESVDEFGCRFASLPPHEAEKEFQKILLLGLADLNVGLYSKFHDVTLYGYGYDSAESRRLAHM
jgi:hypothetical protein